MIGISYLLVATYAVAVNAKHVAVDVQPPLVPYKLAELPPFNSTGATRDAFTGGVVQLHVV
jgi:hypothetical protein